MSVADLGSLEIAVSESSTLQAHFVQRNGDVVVFDVQVLQQKQVQELMKQTSSMLDTELLM